MRVPCLSQGFNLSNGVRQGGILSPFLFAVYLEGLIEELSNSGDGCYWGSLFAGAVVYADDVVLLAQVCSQVYGKLSVYQDAWIAILRGSMTV